MIISDDGLYRFSAWNSIPGLYHGTTSRALGDSRDIRIRHHVAHLVGQDPMSVRTVRQVHSATVTPEQDVAADTAADGLVTGKNDVVLGIHTADCAPLFFVDPDARIVGIAHAGWKGTMKGIAQKAVYAMEKNGANRKRILAGIGPAIGVCCYVVDGNRAALFADAFGADVVRQTPDGWYIDLARANEHLLVESGISKERISKGNVCTSCSIDTCYSYRKDTKETFGEMFSIIGFSA